MWENAGRRRRENLHRHRGDALRRARKGRTAAGRCRGSTRPSPTVSRGLPGPPPRSRPGRSSEGAPASAVSGFDTTGAIGLSPAGCGGAFTTPTSVVISPGLLRRPSTSSQSPATEAGRMIPNRGRGTQSPKRAVEAAWLNGVLLRSAGETRCRSHPRHTFPAESIAWLARHSSRAAAPRAVDACLTSYSGSPDFIRERKRGRR